MDQEDHIPGKHPHRGIFVSLILAIILLAGVFVLFIYSAFLAPEPEEPVASDLEQAIEDSILEDIEEAQIEEDDEEIPEHFDSFVSFDYPLGWHIYHHSADGVILAAPEPVQIGFIEGGSQPLSITLSERNPEQFEGFSSYVDSVANYFLEQSPDNTLKEMEINGTTVSIFQGLIQENPHDNAPAYMEQIILETDTNIVEILLIDPYSARRYAESFDIIKNSLDFTNIQ